MNLELGLSERHSKRGINDFILTKTSSHSATKRDCGRSETRSKSHSLAVFKICRCKLIVSHMEKTVQNGCQCTSH